MREKDNSITSDNHQQWYSTGIGLCGQHPALGRNRPQSQQRSMIRTFTELEREPRLAGNVKAGALSLSSCSLTRCKLSIAIEAKVRDGRSCR
eukprot:scaffold7961_cov309-Prasinococcus_capsulatus_cf.AAC.2